MGHAGCGDSQTPRENEEMRRRDSACKQRIMGRVWLIAKWRKSESAREKEKQRGTRDERQEADKICKREWTTGHVREKKDIKINRTRERKERKQSWRTERESWLHELQWNISQSNTRVWLWTAKNKKPKRENWIWGPWSCKSFFLSLNLLLDVLHYVCVANGGGWIIHVTANGLMRYSE